MKKQKVTSQKKGQHKTPEKQLNGDKQSSRKRNQNNDSEYDSGSQRKNEGKDWENVRNVYQRPTRTKEQAEMNSSLEGIHSD